MSAKRSLKDLLNTPNLDSTVDEDAQALNPAEDAKSTAGMCVDCGDQPLELNCLDCDEGFCEVCFGYIHRTGKRSHHRTSKVASTVEHDSPQSSLQTPGVVEEDTMEVSVDVKEEGLSQVQLQEAALEKFKGNTKFIPVRLTLEERKLLRLLEAALHVSEYIDKIDIYAYSSKTKRIVAQLKEMCTVLTGLVVANGLEAGKELMDGKDFAAHAEWFQNIFEIGRRYKIMNPDKMWSTHGKMAYMIMDSRLPEVKEIMEFDLYKPVNTVYTLLEQCEALAMLDDPLVLVATREISAENRNRRDIQADIRAKERAINSLAKKYGKHRHTDLIEQALYSIGDYHAYLGANRVPVMNMIGSLKGLFDPVNFEKGFSLGISSGQGGSRLSHNHQKQYQYVLQSLTLWSEIMRDMYMLWKLADEDLASDSVRYTLVDTGQGLNRVKPCPKVGRAMHNILSRAQKLTGSWVGSSVIHLGDRAVPNALFFLDKYLQVPRILNPVNNVIKLLPEALHDPYAHTWVENQFKSVDILVKTILADFFRHAFDGSGADNFYDAGSCIDGRLTSAWNWANTLPKKVYYKHFLITGFIGFDTSQ